MDIEPQPSEFTLGLLVGVGLSVHTKEHCVKSLITASILVLSGASSGAFAAEAGSMDPAGTWATENAEAKIKIEKCGADHVHLCGNVVWLKEPNDDKGRPKTDAKNPDPAKRSRPALGMALFNDLAPDDDNRYTGQIYNAENGKTYDVTFSVEEPNDIKVKGCVLSILCGSQHWTKVADIPSAVVASQVKGKAKTAPAE